MGCCRADGASPIGFLEVPNDVTAFWEALYSIRRVDEYRNVCLPTDFTNFGSFHVSSGDRSGFVFETEFVEFLFYAGTKGTAREGIQDEFCHCWYIRK